VPRVEATAVVPLDPDRAFALSQTYGELRYKWDPFVIEQRLLDGAVAAGKGVRTWTRSRHRLTMISQYVAFRPPEHVGMRMLSGPWFFATFSGGWNFQPVEGGTRATWRYNFTIRPPWLAPVADRIGVFVLGRDIRRRVEAFARACADPEIVAALGAPASQPSSEADQPEEA
jgi:ribosome-associated toxin RatA of RatAB toxin-antitoxin module